MKKTLVSLLILSIVVLAAPTLAADRACAPIWDQVAGQNFTLSVGEQEFQIAFSDSYVGPCPQGIVEVYDGVYIAPRLTLPYISGNDFVILDLGAGGELKLYLTPAGSLEQIVFPPDRIILERVAE